VALAAMATAHGATLAIRNVTVIDPADGSARAKQTIVIAATRITAVGKAAPPKNAKIIDGSGKYAIPGLWDMHVHLWDTENPLGDYVRRGITGIRDMGSDYTRVRPWRKAVATGQMLGPRIITCGPAIDGKPSTEDRLPVVVIRDPEQARREFDRLDRMQVDFIKILDDLPRDAYFALAERARHWHKPFAGHLPKGITMEEAIDARQASVEHFFRFPLKDEERGRNILQRCAKFGTRLTPTLTLWQRMAKDDAEAREALPRVNALVKLAAELNAPLLAGTDTGDPGTEPGWTLHDELALLVEAGLTPVEALRTATIEPARTLGWDESLGRIAKGMTADIVLLSANPLADIHNTRKVVGVVARGLYVDPIARIARPRAIRASQYRRPNPAQPDRSRAISTYRPVRAASPVSIPRVRAQ
jgi:imidazolonepropionase-like amidohydrolase